jgi:glucose-6-phosphate dehydrogenase assembly protein OpcA
MEEAVTAAPSTRPSDVLARVEGELRDIWAQPETGGEPPKSRVCTMNLVVVAGSRRTAEDYTSIVDEVTQSIPARAILVALEPDASTSALEGFASAVCAIGEGGRNICSERIRLTVSGAMCARAGNAALALLVPEIPTSLVWLGRAHTDDPVFQSIADAASRIIVDTAHTSLSSLVHVARWAREEPARPRLADLAWTRLAPWQEMCARFFDEPRLRDLSSAITKITVQQASDKGAPLGSEGSLLLGWLATRLGWKIASVGGALRFTRPDRAAIAVQLGAVARPPGVAAFSLAGVAVEATSGAQRLHGTVTRDLGTNVAAWRLDALGTTIEQSIRLTTYSEASVLERTLHRPPSDLALEETVQFVEDFAEDGITCV